VKSRTPGTGVREAARGTFAASFVKVTAEALILVAELVRLGDIGGSNCLGPKQMSAEIGVVSNPGKSMSTTPLAILKVKGQNRVQGVGSKESQDKVGVEREIFPLEPGVGEGSKVSPKASHCSNPHVGGGYPGSFGLDLEFTIADNSFLLVNHVDSQTWVRSSPTCTP
jgi:hypothetical protein